MHGVSLSWMGKRDAMAIVSSTEAHRGTHFPWWKVGGRATRARYRWKIGTRRKEKLSPSLPFSLPGKKTTINLSTGRRYGVLGIERIPGYLTSIVRIRVAVATATAIVNTILNSIENLSPRLKRRPASGGRRTAPEEGWRHGSG